MMACRIGFQSVRERGRAVIVLWFSAALVVVAYYLVPGVASAHEPVGNWQRENGWLASFVFCAVFCGAIPYVVYLLRGERERRSPFVTAVFYAVLSGGWRVKDERVPFGTFVREAYLPTLVMNWIVGIPSNCAVYAFPMDLQIPVLGFLSSAWAVICVGLGAHSGRAIHAVVGRRSSRIRS